MPRDTEYGSPFRNVGSGVDEDKDSQNQTRFAQGLKNFSAQLKSKTPTISWLFSIFSNKIRLFWFYDLRIISCNNTVMPE